MNAEDRMIAARDARKKLAEDRAAKKAISEPEREARREEIELANEIAIADAEDKIGPLGEKIMVVRCVHGAIILKAPNHIKFRKFQDSTINVDTVEALVADCRVYPVASEFDRWITDQPGVLQRCCEAIGNLAGLREPDFQAKR